MTEPTNFADAECRSDYLQSDHDDYSTPTLAEAMRDEALHGHHYDPQTGQWS